MSTMMIHMGWEMILLWMGKQKVTEKQDGPTRFPIFRIVRCHHADHQKLKFKELFIEVVETAFLCMEIMQFTFQKKRKDFQ